jgi:hypothetical protein
MNFSSTFALPCCFGKQYKYYCPVDILYSVVRSLNYCMNTNMDGGYHVLKGLGFF